MSASLALTRAVHSLAARAAAAADSDDRGDVPAWVLITVMTAGIVGVLWTFAQDQLHDLLDDAFTSATSKH
ncbi:hypothetical protein CLV35_2927 [Motilibacter peucedani]|uniref:Flagellin-like protein n=1 Tax=Motilibacter peucedani TaxID=598650 RepID=A0A420XN18_9ACTN|nr:hypothetical protein [Motilibacter peucedani]RKS72678.1 hypothetical protein CLV35_2927 [Motilibacter peucedani]